MNESNRAKYLKKFEEDFFAVVKRQIDYHMAYVCKKDALYDEILEHTIQCKILHERYFPRDDILEKVRDSFQSLKFSSRIYRSNYFFDRMNLAVH